jgi:hypothetical protein
MKSILLWVALAVLSALLAGGAISWSLVHASESADAAAAQQDSDNTNPDARQEYLQLHRRSLEWMGVATACELLCLALWIKVAAAWNRRSPKRRTWRRYSLMIAVGVAGPLALVSLFFALV